MTENEKEDLEMNRNILNILISVVVLLIFVVGFFGWQKYQANQAALKAALAEKARMEAIFKIATVQKGNGVEHCLQRQLVADPARFGFKGNVTDQKAVSKWAKKQADVLARKAGLIANDGREIRIKANAIGKVAYVLNDGKIVACAKGAAGEIKAIASFSVAFDKSSFIADFVADMDIAGYQYIYSPVVTAASTTSSIALLSTVVAASITGAIQ